VDQERKELHRSLINHREAIHGQMVFIDGPWIASSGLRSSANTNNQELLLTENWLGYILE
jgi:hypothetical protein